MTLKLAPVNDESGVERVRQAAPSEDRRSAVLCVVERRGVAHGDEQSLRARQPSGDLAPGLRAGIVDQPIALRTEFGGRRGTSATSNSMLAWGAGISAGHSLVPKQAFAASESGHRPKCLVPSSLWVNT